MSPHRGRFPDGGLVFFWGGAYLFHCYRLRVERNGDRVRLITRGGHNWTDHYPRIVEAARKTA